MKTTWLTVVATTVHLVGAAAGPALGSEKEALGAGASEQGVTASSVKRKAPSPKRPTQAPSRPAPRPPAERGPALGRVFLSSDGLFQSPAPELTQVTTFVRHGEDAQLSGVYQDEARPGFDLRGTVRLWGGISVGVGIARTSRAGTALMKGTMPHPLYFNQPRAVAARVDAMESGETIVAVNAGWLVPIGRRVVIGFEGGPSFVSAQRDIVDEVTLTERYPFDEIDLVGAEVVRLSQSTMGLGAGVDVAYHFSGAVGVGAHLRFTHASLCSRPRVPRFQSKWAARRSASACGSACRPAPVPTAPA